MTPAALTGTVRACLGNISVLLGSTVPKSWNWRKTVPDPRPGEVRIKALDAGTGFTTTFIRRGRYPDFKGPLPFTPGYDLAGVVETTGRGVTAPREGQLVADLCVVDG